MAKIKNKLNYLLEFVATPQSTYVNAQEDKTLAQKKSCRRFQVLLVLVIAVAAAAQNSGSLILIIISCWDWCSTPAPTPASPA